jgi:phosphohistidine phosphatase SixA
MGGLLARLDLTPDLVLCSTAARALQTAEVLAEALDDPPVRALADLYGAGPDELAAAVADVPDDALTVLVIAHNPGIEQWLADFGEDTDVPTATVARVDLNIESWTEPDLESHARVADVWRPREVVADHH